MGKENDALLSYLEDNMRFADLFNCFYFGGRQMVKAKDLEQASELYPPDEKAGQKGPRIRDIKKRLLSGGWLKLLAVEAQSEISYAMPWRIMDYDCREYGQQIRQIQRKNRDADAAGRLQNRTADAAIQRPSPVYGDAGERLGQFRREDRIAPVYTLCLYHGTEEWNGPRSLMDMMDFGPETPGSESQTWKNWFADYPMRLICANEPTEKGIFRTSLGILFALLPYRKDKSGLRRLLERETAYRNMDEETARTVSVLMGIKSFMKKTENYREGDGYNMCKAIQDMMEDSRMEGWEAGEKAGWKKGEKAREDARIKEEAKGIRIFIQSNRDDGAADEIIADKLQKYYAMSAQNAWAALSRE